MNADFLKVFLNQRFQRLSASNLKSVGDSLLCKFLPPRFMLWRRLSLC